MFESPDQFYEAIGNELISMFPYPWTFVEVKVKRFESSIELIVVYTKPDGSKESDVDAIMLSDYFFELANVISTPEKGLYKTCKFSMDNSGKFNVEFQY